jgi:phosphatidylserine/phosphatidylglycerophosphate/cardiolipin synthase-like enzyme
VDNQVSFEVKRQAERIEITGLSLNLEANLIIHDRQFNQTLRDNLEALLARDCQVATSYAAAGGRPAPAGNLWPATLQGCRVRSG